LKTGFRIARHKNASEWFDKYENAINQLKERVIKLNEIVNEYELSGDHNFKLDSIDTIKEDLEKI
jgi:hypothetical protein